ncbi:hypothetical protein [Ornithinibacillus halophilus]|uniref:Uncharacterized protein n=1 Tax=Ornithinibacillus halophilus TaxID=930117 RepID=A0A1M5DUW2_9BACI|nr:hypothetical protein [Ornithinibacillus halophilus]SHF70602.1 hypothetical protein SAMN05216225_100310 [Ornithinibacillus halophilus]
MKERILWIGIILIVISSVGNYIYFKSKQIEEPIFLEHYITSEFYEDTEEIIVTFYYLTNKDNPVTVQSANIDGFPIYTVNDGIHIAHGFYSEQIEYQQEYTHQYLMAAHFEIPADADYLPMDDDGILSFQQITVHLSNGKTINADIGKVTIVDAQEYHQGPLDWRAGGSSSNHKEWTSLLAKESVIINEVVFPYPELEEQIAIKINVDKDKSQELETNRTQNQIEQMHEGFDQEWNNIPGISLDEGVLPLELERNDWIEIYQQYDYDRSSVFEFEIQLKGQTNNGEFVEKLFVNDQPYLEQEDVDRIIDEKEVGGHE